MTADLQQQTEVEVTTQPPVEQATGAEKPDEPTGEVTADAKPPEGEDADKKSRRHINAIQNRINELTREKHDERRAREAAEQRASQLESEFRKAQGTAAEPRLEHFKTYDEFVDAKASWKAEQIVAARLEEFSQKNLKTFEERNQQERAVQVAQQFDHALQAVEKDGAAKFKDFTDVISNGPKLGPQVGSLVLQTEKPAEISYYLAKNPDHAIAIASMPPLMQAREIGKLEAQFAKRVTSAPPPPKTVGGSERSSTALSDDLPPDEWYRRRQAQLRQGKG